MPSKIQLDENLWFLYICLQKSDLKTIDFTAVGASTNLKPPAARMRYTRLRRQIESGTLIGTHGTPFSGSADKIYEASTKRKQASNSKKSIDNDDKDTEPEQKRSPRAAKTRKCKDKGKRNDVGAESDPGDVVRVKEESDFDSDDSDFEDSEDEMPLAKLRKARLGPFASPSKPYTSPYPQLTGAGGGIEMASGGMEVPGSMVVADADFQESGPRFQNPFPFRFDALQFNDASGGSSGSSWQNVDWARYQDLPSNRLGTRDLF